jgi:hypothetical protein
MEFHPQRAGSAKKRRRGRAKADSSEQVLDSKDIFPAHLVIVLSK